MQSDLAKTLEELVYSLEGRISADVLNKAADTINDVIDLLRTGKLIALPDDAVELIARGLCDRAILECYVDKSRADELSEYRAIEVDIQWRDFIEPATAALDALTKGTDHAG